MEANSWTSLASVLPTQRVPSRSPPHRDVGSETAEPDGDVLASEHPPFSAVMIRHGASRLCSPGVRRLRRGRVTGLALAPPRRPSSWSAQHAHLRSWGATLGKRPAALALMERVSFVSSECRLGANRQTRLISFWRSLGT